jgi:predicted DsbA family dithiol-disulfide isomerase
MLQRIGSRVVMTGHKRRMVEAFGEIDLESEEGKKLLAATSSHDQLANDEAFQKRVFATVPTFVINRLHINTLFCDE